MAEQDKEQLAKLLAAMANSEAGPQTQEPAPVAPSPAEPATPRPAGQSRPARPAAPPTMDALAAAARSQAETAPYASMPWARSMALAQTLGYKRTLIPILLTCGVMLPVIASLPLWSGEDSVFRQFPTWLSAMLCFVGAALLGLGALTMFQVRRQVIQRP